ncbi:ATP-binding protein, partial [Lysinibacillus sp. GbtcB16]
MLQHMTHLASLHAIGILIIDEIQHLNLSKSGGSDKMLNFFVTLVNTIGIPVVMVGTNKAISILQSEFRQARRGSGQGDMVWGQMPKDDTWDLFVEGMWDYQW